MTSHYPGFLDDIDSIELFHFLLTNAQWQVWSLSPNSRPVAQYQNQIPFLLEKVMTQIESNFNVKLLRQAFLNIYRNGDDYCPYHADSYGLNTFTLSLGETRDFLLKSNQKGQRAEKTTLHSGDLYYMDKNIHLTHKHSIPKRKNVINPRISILMFAS